MYWLMNLSNFNRKHKHLNSTTVENSATHNICWRNNTCWSAPTSLGSAEKKTDKTFKNDWGGRWTPNHPPVKTIKKIYCIFRFTHKCIKLRNNWNKKIKRWHGNIKSSCWSSLIKCCSQRRSAKYLNFIHLSADKLSSCSKIKQTVTKGNG